MRTRLGAKEPSVVWALDANLRIGPDLNPPPSESPIPPDHPADEVCGRRFNPAARSPFRLAMTVTKKHPAKENEYEKKIVSSARRCLGRAVGNPRRHEPIGEPQAESPSLHFRRSVIESRARVASFGGTSHPTPLAPLRDRLC